MKLNQLQFAAIVASAIVVPSEIFAQDKRAVPQAAFDSSRAGAFPSLGGATEWLNSPALTPTALRGKVVLIDFGTYTCINWIRTLPYVRAWAEKYKNQGLVVIGVHTPEFSFEKNIDSVRRAVKNMQLDFPIAVDSDYAIWRAFRNDAWPALYFIDAQGPNSTSSSGRGSVRKLGKGH